MKAFLMAAGAGTRLRPLTYEIPKPMVPVVNKPVIEYTLETLKRHGINKVALNLHHYPETIKNYFGKGSKLGMELRYSYEKKLMGTAGGVKLMEKFLDTTFVVMSGDGLTDINLTKAIRYHQEKRSLATMVLKGVDTRFEYGVTLADKGGRIRKFIEKPRWSDVFANTVNTGIYILEPEVLSYIPRNEFCDFGMHVWPKLLKMKKRIFGYTMQEFWTDIGNLTEYRRGVRDALDDKIHINIPGEQVSPGVWVGTGTRMEKGAILNGPCVLGQNCRIGKNAVIDCYTTIGDGCCIGSGATIKNSILWDVVTVANNVRLDNCIIGHGARVSEDITVYEGTVLNIKTKKEG